MIPKIAVTLGDYNGIGPEVALKTLTKIDFKRSIPILIGHEKIVAFYRNRLEVATELPPFNILRNSDNAKPGHINIMNVINAEEVNILPGTISKSAGFAAMRAVKKAVDLAKKSNVQAMVTAPISKEAVNMAGWDIPGHTEFLAQHTQCSDYMMMLVNDDLRVGLVSIHDPLRKVIEKITRHQIIHQIQIMNRSLKADFSIKNPNIAVLGLNPHAGDGGYIGREEIETIAPAIEQARSTRIQVDGPFAADGFFGNRHYTNYRGILAMYHDQGLIPFKTLSFNAGVNFTAGLPIIRTSPDHGTAFDIAGQQKASCNSIWKAYCLAVELSQKRKEKG